MNRREYGAGAEKSAAKWLKENGYTILDMNFYIRGGELDIVAQKDDTVAFVEVRSWDREFWENGTPLETINEAKKRHIIKTALFYIQKKGICLQSYNIRFDVAGLIKNSSGEWDIDYIEGAFDIEQRY